MSPTNPEKGRRMWRWYLIPTAILCGAAGLWVDLPTPWDLVAWGGFTLSAVVFLIEIARGNVFALALLFPLAVASQAAPLMAQEARSGVGVGLIAFGKPVRPERLNCVRWGWSGGFDLALRFSYEADEGRWGPYARLTVVPVTSLHVWDAGAILPLLILWAAGRHLKHVAPYIGGVVGGITRGIARLGERVGGPSPGYTLPPDFQADNERTEPEPEE